MKKTFGEKCADLVASFVGSWSFIIVSSVQIIAWMAFNTFSKHPFDPPPFIGLNLVLSCLAAYQASLVMISANRQAQIDRERDEQDFSYDKDTNERIKRIESILNSTCHK